MTTRCKNGDIAIVLHDDPGCEANIGRLVEVSGPRTSPAYPDLVCWRIRQVDRHALWAVREGDGRITEEWLTWGSGVSHPDAWLLPIRPDQPDEANEVSQGNPVNQTLVTSA